MNYKCTQRTVLKCKVKCKSAWSKTGRVPACTRICGKYVQCGMFFHVMYLKQQLSSILLSQT